MELCSASLIESAGGGGVATGSLSACKIALDPPLSHTGWLSLQLLLNQAAALWRCRSITNTFTIDDEELGELLEITVGHDAGVFVTPARC